MCLMVSLMIYYIKLFILDPFNFYQGGSKGIEISARSPVNAVSGGVGGMFDPGLAKLFQKAVPLEKQYGMYDKLETLLKNTLSKKNKLKILFNREGNNRLDK